MPNSTSVAEEHISTEEYLVLDRLFVRRLEESEFHDISEAWNQLLSESIADSFFLRWEWIHSWWEIFQDGRELWILAAFQDKDLIGLGGLDHNSQQVSHRLWRWTPQGFAVPAC
jgi:hypothetical protein